MGVERPGMMKSSTGELRVDDVEEGCPDSWEMADLEDSMIRLMPPSSSSSSSSSSRRQQKEPLAVEVAATEAAAANPAVQVDEFLREALQNPHDRLTILRLEQEVQKFVKNPMQQQFEFPPMPSSYMRLAAHRVAQHYYLQTSLIDSSYAEGCRIIVRKSGETRFPTTKLSDVPVSTPQEDNQTANVKFVIKQRPQERVAAGNGTGAASGGGTNPSKTVEERNEEYNRARARIFREQRAYDELVELESRCFKVPEASKDGPEYLARRGSKAAEPAAPPATAAKDQGGKSKQKVAIFRDREKDRKDPDYDRSYDRYSQRFDPGFGLNSSQPAFSVQARYTPVVNYNTEFPQLGCQVRPMPSQAQQGWSHAYQQRQGMMRPPLHSAGMNHHSNMATYMSQYTCTQPYTYSSQIPQQPEPSPAQARRH